MINEKGNRDGSPGLTDAARQEYDFDIPPGWRVIPPGTLIERGDMWWDDDPGENNWNETGCIGSKASIEPNPHPYIRRIEAKPGEASEPSQSPPLTLPQGQQEGTFP